MLLHAIYYDIRMYFDTCSASVSCIVILYSIAILLGIIDHLKRILRVTLIKITGNREIHESQNFIWKEN